MPSETLDQHTLPADSEAAESADRVEVLALTILAHPDPRRVGEVAELADRCPSEHRLSRSEPEFLHFGASGRPLGDRRLSRQPVFLRLTSDRRVILDRAASPTALDLDGFRVDAALEIAPERLRRGVVLLLAQRLALVLRLRSPAISGAADDHGLLGLSPAIERVRSEIGRIAASTVPILLRGETGTGKELVARALHRTSHRRDRSFVSLNMAAVPAELAAAELFGAARGAFTGADRSREGFFRRAHQGTLFLDEVGETPAAVQPLLLRALESGEIQPLGSAEVQQVDVRILAATDTELETAAEGGDFSAPLLHRLAGYQLRIPPLRDRREDVGLLLYSFLRDELAALGRQDLLDGEDQRDAPWVPAPLIARLATLAWPGNVRQLRNVTRQLVLSSLDRPSLRADEDLLRSAGLHPTSAPPESVAARGFPASYRNPKEVSDEELVRALRDHAFRIKPAAAQLQVSRTSLYALMERSPAVRQTRDLTPQAIADARSRHGDDLDALAAELEVSAPALRRRLRELDLDQNGGQE